MTKLYNKAGLNILERSMVSVVTYPGVVDEYPKDFIVVAKYFDMADALNTVYAMNNLTPEGQHRAFIVDIDGQMIGFKKQEETQGLYNVGPKVC